MARESFLPLISDDLNHTKHSIYVYMEYIMRLLKQKYIYVICCLYILSEHTNTY